MKFKNYIETESGIKDTSTSPGTSGQLLSSTVAGTSWIDQDTIHSGSSEVVDIQVKNISSGNGGVSLSKGDPVYIYGSVGASPRLYVDLADADSTATNNLGDGKMPCVGLLDQDLTPNGEGTATVVGKLRNLITSPIDSATPSENDTVYVKSGGGLTLTKPTGSTNLIQNVGQVGRVSTSADGNIVVAALLRSNDVPNLPTGKIWVGDGNTIVSDTVYVDEPNNRVGIGINLPSQKLHVQGNARLTGLFYDGSNSGGTSGQILSSDGGQTEWINGSAIPGVPAGSGTTNYLARWTPDADTLGIGATYDNGTNVGIGTDSPQEKLHVYSSSSGPVRMEVESSGANDAVVKYTNSNRSYANFLSTDGKFYVYDYNAASLRTVIDTNGNFGIGTTSPSTVLEVSSSGVNGVDISQSASNASQSGRLFFTTNTASEGFALFNSNGTFQVNSGGIPNNTSGNNRISIIGSSGNVGIGTTSPSHKLQVVGNALVSGTVYINNTSSSIYRFFNELIIQNTASTSISIGGGPGGVTNNLEVNGVVTATASTDAYKGYIKQTIATIANEKGAATANYNLIPYNTITTTTSNQYYNRMAAAYDGRIKKVYIVDTGGTTPDATVVNFKKQINNVTSGTVYSATVTGSGSGMSAYYDFADNDFTFNAGDIFGILYQTTDSGGGARTMGGVAINIIVEYNIT